MAVRNQYVVNGLTLTGTRRVTEHFTAVVTFSFIPLEIYEFTRRVTLARGLLLPLNIAVVIYLAIDLRRTR
jgi:uncharacterized membrane protein (DUF2068 family)